MAIKGPTYMAQNVPKWPKMAQNGQKISFFHSPTKVASEQVVWITPPPGLWGLVCRNSSGRPIILPSQSITIVSSSVQAGLEA